MLACSICIHFLMIGPMRHRNQHQLSDTNHLTLAQHIRCQKSDMFTYVTICQCVFCSITFPCSSKNIPEFALKGSNLESDSILGKTTIRHFNIFEITFLFLYFTTLFLYPPQRGYISFVNTFVTPRNNDLAPYVPWRHLISTKL